MKKYSLVLPALLGFFALTMPFAFADAASISIQSLVPGSSGFAKDILTFSIATAGFLPQSYTLSDSFPGSTASVGNIDGGGNFVWVPLTGDIGTHVFTVTASDNGTPMASTTQTIVILPPPSLSIQSVVSGTAVNPGSKATFVVSANGFTNFSYTVTDSFSGSSVSNANIDNLGNFSWTPDIEQNGDHSITVYASDTNGHHASITQSLHVGPRPGITVLSLSPGTRVPVATTTSFFVSPTAFTPTSFGVSDSFPGSSLVNTDITGGGFFSWVPQASDVGVHVITVQASVGPFGQSATTTQTITVLGSGGIVSPVPTVQVQTPASVASLIPNPSAAPSFTSAFTAALRLGSKGDGVTRLQNVLAQQGFLSGTPTGYYGALTVAAVKKFQATHGIAQLGTVGPATRIALNALSSAPQAATTSTATPSTTGDGYVFKNFIGFGEDTNDGADVIELQKRLTALGLFSGDTTGVFGNITALSVKKFQKAHGIEATGYVGSATRAVLNK